MNNKGKWKVTSQVLGETRKYAVCRVIDTSKVEHNGNREYTDHGYMVDKAEAEAIANDLNNQEAQIFPTAQQPAKKKKVVEVAILIDELMKDRELVGNYILFLQREIDDKVWTQEDCEMMHDYMFGEENNEQVKDSMKDIKEWTTFFTENKGAWKDTQEAQIFPTA